MLTQLGDRYSIPLLMQHQGYSDEDIAQKLSISVASARKRIKQAREKMLRLIQTQYN